jgi:hypothetical protein
MNAPMSATAPPSAQMNRINGNELSRAATNAGLMKMPDPMMPPTTTIVASKGPSARRKATARSL